MLVKEYFTNHNNYIFNQQMERYANKYGKERADKYRDRLWKDTEEYRKARYDGFKDGMPEGWWTTHKDKGQADAIEARIQEWEGEDLKGSSGTIQAQSTIQGGPNSEVGLEGSAETDKDTEMTKRKSKSKGKRGFRISREQGQGLNI